MCMRAQVLKRDPVTQLVTLAMASIPAMDSSVFPGPKGKFLLLLGFSCSAIVLFIVTSLSFTVVICARFLAFDGPPSHHAAV